MKKKERSEIGEMLILIMQIGISMIVPIGLMVALSVFIVNKTGIKWISIILFIMGAAAGMRNVYKLVKKYLKETKEPYELAEEARQQEECDSDLTQTEENNESNQET